MYVFSYDNSQTYQIDKSGELFWSIFNYATLGLLYIYPKFFSWFEEKVISGLNVGERTIFASYSDKNQFTGYMILKNSKDEQKICTLQVLPQYRLQGYGRELMKTALQLLKTPVITVSSRQLDRYTGLLSEFNFQLIKTIDNLYVQNEPEYIFLRQEKTS